MINRISSLLKMFLYTFYVVLRRRYFSSQYLTLDSNITLNKLIKGIFIKEVTKGRAFGGRGWNFFFMLLVLLEICSVAVERLIIYDNNTRVKESTNIWLRRIRYQYWTTYNNKVYRKGQ